MSLAPVPSEQPDAPLSCANCSAPLAPDQRYCLACGRPVSPVRPAFLDVLQADAQSYGVAQTPVGALPPGYAPVIEPTSGAAWTLLRRYSGLFGLLSVLLLAILVGLLVGHWVTQSSSAPSRQVVRVEGLGALAAAPAAAAASTTPASATTATTPTSTTGTTSSKAAAKSEAHEAQEAKAIEKAPPPKAVKVTPTKLKNLGSSTGKKHEEEVNSLGAQPIETGG